MSVRTFVERGWPRLRPGCLAPGCPIYKVSYVWSTIEEMAYIVFDFVIIELVELVFCCPFGHRSDCSKDGSRVALPREERETRPTGSPRVPSDTAGTGRNGGARLGKLGSALPTDLCLSMIKLSCMAPHVFAHQIEGI